jgi:hypothetical protein
MLKSNYRILLFIVLAIIVLITPIIIAYVFEDMHHKEGKMNYYNSKRIYKGMKKNDMIIIMGIPDTIVNGNLYIYPNSFKIYEYTNRIGSSDDIHIVIDTNNCVHDLLSSN